MRLPSLLLLALGAAGGDEDAQPMGASQGIFQASDADLSTATTSAPTAAATIPPTATPTAAATTPPTAILYLWQSFAFLGHNLQRFGMHGQGAELRGDNTS